MINHILVPLDGSALAECSLPHVLAIGVANNARITLLHVLELQHTRGIGQVIDPLEWHLKKQEASGYLTHIADRLKAAHLTVDKIILEGLPADSVIDYANNEDIDLIALSTHGNSGLSGWTISSVVQKIIMRSYKSTLLVRAYRSSAGDLTKFRYNRLFVGLDCSTRAEYILPTAVKLAQIQSAQLVLGMVIRQPEILDRFPPSDEEFELANRINNRNRQVAAHYLEQIHSQVSTQGIDLQTRLIVSDNITNTLHEMVEQEKADLVMLVAHGRTGDDHWPYGSIATSFITYGTTPLLLMQDLSAEAIKRTPAEEAARETKGH